MSMITDSLTNQTSSLVFFAIDFFHSLLLFPVPRYDLETDSKILIGDSDFPELLFQIYAFGKNDGRRKSRTKFLSKISKSFAARPRSKPGKPHEIQVVSLYMRLVLYSYQKALQIQPSAKLMTGRMSHETDCLVCQAQCQSYHPGYRQDFF